MHGVVKDLLVAPDTAAQSAQASGEKDIQTCLEETEFSKPQGKRAPAGPSDAWGGQVRKILASERLDNIAYC